MTDQAGMRAIFEAEAAARLALRRAKAERYVGEIERGEKATLVWQRIALDADVQRLEDDYEAARIEASVLRIMLRVPAADGEVESSAEVER